MKKLFVKFTNTPLCRKSPPSKQKKDFLVSEVIAHRTSKLKPRFKVLVQDVNRNLLPKKGQRPPNPPTPPLSIKQQGKKEVLRRYFIYIISADTHIPLDLKTPKLSENPHRAFTTLAISNLATSSPRPVITSQQSCATENMSDFPVVTRSLSSGNDVTQILKRHPRTANAQVGRKSLMMYHHTSLADLVDRGKRTWKCRTSSQNFNSSYFYI